MMDVEQQNAFIILDSLPTPVYLQTPDHSIEFANRAFRACFGEPAGRHTGDIFSSGEGVLADRVFATHAPETGEFTGVNGRTYKAHADIFSNGPGGMVLMTLTDITEREAQQAHQRFALRCVGLGLWKYDVQTDHLTIDEQWANTLGYIPGELGPNLATWRALIHPEDRSKMHDTVDKHLEGQTAFFETEYRLYTKSNGWRWVSCWGRVVERDADGAPLCIAGAHRDITAQKQAETSQQESEKRLQLAVDGANLGLWCWHLDTNLMIVNKRWTEMIGYTTGELRPIYNLVAEFVHPDDIPVVVNALNEYIEGIRPFYEAEHRLLTKSGEWKWVLARGKIVKYDKDGNPLHMAGTHLDITARKQAAERMIESERKFRRIVEQSQDGIVLIDEEGLVMEWNKGMEQIIGVKRPTVLGQPVWKIIQNHAGPRRHGQSFRRHVLRVLEDGAASYLGKKSEQRIKHLDGTQRIVQQTFFSIQTRSSFLIGATLRDITDSKRAEQALRESEEQYRRLAEAATDIIITHDMSGRITYANQAAQRLSGYSEAELRKMYLVDFMRSEEIERAAIRRDRRAQNDRQVHIYELNCLDKVGNEIPLEVHSSPIVEDDKVTGVHIVGRDISERKWAEQRALELAIEKEKVKVLENFIRDASHDIRTPMTTIKLNLELLEKKADPVKVDRYLSIIQTQAAHLEKLLEDLFTMSRLDKSDHFEMQSVDLNAVVHSVVQQHGAVAQLKQHSMSFLPDLNIPDVLADPPELSRALSAIVSNALNYTPDGGLIIVRTYQRPQQVIVEVQDTGIGIAAGDLPHIFERFFRADRARNTAQGGVGLGLTIAKKIVEAHLGIIEIESTPGRGSTFRVLLPIIFKHMPTAKLNDR